MTLGAGSGYRLSVIGGTGNRLSVIGDRGAHQESSLSQADIFSVVGPFAEEPHGVDSSADKDARELNGMLPDQVNNSQRLINHRRLRVGAWSEALAKVLPIDSIKSVTYLPGSTPITDYRSPITDHRLPFTLPLAVLV